MDPGDYFRDFFRRQTHENKHDGKPSHSTSVAGEVKKRLETNVQNKRRTTFSIFDQFRNLPENEPVQEPLNKMAQRKLHLQKWKEEKEKRKAEALVNKKKPFVVGIPKTSKGFEPPPTVSGLLPSTSGRVTKSQPASKITNNGNKENQIMHTFTPRNVSFNPTLKNLDKPSLSKFEKEKCEKESAMKAKQTNSDTTKTSEAGFFSVQSPVKSPVAATPPPRTTSLLQSVLSDEAKKASAEKANLVPATPINLGLTPEKSILKSNNNTSTKVASKISFKLFNMDTGSDSSPTSDDGQISGVEKLQDNVVTINTEEEKKENRQSSRKKRETLHNAEDNVVTETTEEEKKENKQSSRKERETLHNAEDNAVIIDIEREDKENEQSSRKKRDTNNNLMTMNTEECLEYKESGQSSRGRPKLVRQYAVDQVLPPALTKE